MNTRGLVVVTRQIKSEKKDLVFELEQEVFGTLTSSAKEEHGSDEDEDDEDDDY